MISLPFTILLLASLVHPHTLLPRKSRSDNALLCFESQYTSYGSAFWHNLPDPTSHVWPPGYPRSPTDYKNLRDLCAWFPDGPPSLGCVCFDYDDRTRIPMHECKLEYADPQLWAKKELLTLCRDACHCPVSYRDEKGRTIADVIATLEGDVPDPPPRDIVLPGDGEGGDGGGGSGESSDEGFHPVFDFSSRGQGRGTERTRGSTLGVNLGFAQPKCGRACRGSDFKCSRGGRNCVCEAKALGRGLWDIAGCVAAVGSTLGKRDGGLVCPCNTTYVSSACCQAEGGLVWEALDQKRGVLDLQSLEH